MNTVAGVGGSLLRARPAFVAEIEIPVPPLSEQKRIADILAAAHRIWRGIIQLYSDKPWAKEAVERARQALQANPESPPEPGK